MPPLISVVIPTYNHAHFLGRALASVRDQSYPNWEALVVDNHSDDDTDRVVGQFGDPRVRLFKIRNEGVIAASRNLGMREARGEWIAFLDSDDCWYPKKLEAAITIAATADRYDVIANNELRVEAANGHKSVLHHGPYEDDFYKVMLISGNRLSPSATMVRRDFLLQQSLRFDECPDHATVEDYGFWLDVARAGARFCFIDEVLGEFVVHAGGSSAQLERHLKNSEHLLRHHVFNVQQFEPVPQRLWQQVELRLRLGSIGPHLAKGEIGASVALAWEVLRTSPLGMARYAVKRLRKGLARR